MIFPYFIWKIGNQKNSFQFLFIFMKKPKPEFGHIKYDQTEIKKFIYNFSLFYMEKRKPEFGHIKYDQNEK